MSKYERNVLQKSPDLGFESALWARGLDLIGGADEAGRGALAGPVAAAVVIFPADPKIARLLYGVQDSKQMTASKRDYWKDRIQLIALGYGIGFSESQEIDELGIVPAVRLAINRALKQLSQEPQHLLVDYLSLPELKIPQTAIIKGDARSLTIAAASILAKTARDAHMRLLDEQYPGYGFARHKGYGTSAHQIALQDLGHCPAHRLSFRFHHKITE